MGGEADQPKKRKGASLSSFPLSTTSKISSKVPQPVAQAFLGSLSHALLLLSLWLDPCQRGLSTGGSGASTKGVMEDIQDGKAYQDLLRPGGFLHGHPRNFVLGFNPRLRFQPKYNRVCGLWCSASRSPSLISSSGPFIPR